MSIDLYRFNQAVYLNIQLMMILNYQKKQHKFASISTTYQSGCPSPNKNYIQDFNKCK